MIETTTYHAIRNHIVREHGEQLNNEATASMLEHRCWAPSITGWGWQLSLDGEDELADLWDCLDAGEQAAMLRDAVEQYQDELAAAREHLA